MTSVTPASERSLTPLFKCRKPDAAIDLLTAVAPTSSCPWLTWIALDPAVRLQGIPPEHFFHRRWSLGLDVGARDADHVGIRIELEAFALGPVAAEHDPVFSED